MSVGQRGGGIHSTSSHTIAPTGTPAPIVKRLAMEVDKAMQGNDAKDRLLAAGVEVDYRRTDNFGEYLTVQKARFADVIKKGNIRIE